MFKKLVLITCLISGAASAKESFSIFVKHEFNGDDQITGIGTSVLSHDSNYNSDLKGEVLTSLNHAKVLDDYDNLQEYVSWELGFRVGYYNKLFIYVEGGLDILEMFASDLNNDDDYYFEDENNGNGIDGYGAIGAGVETKIFRLEGFVKARKIDGDYWQSKHQMFYGVQLSIPF